MYCVYYYCEEVEGEDLLASLYESGIHEGVKRDQFWKIFLASASETKSLIVKQKLEEELEEEPNVCRL